MENEGPIFVVDDEERIRVLVQDALDLIYGGHVRTFANGQEALLAMKQGVTPKLVITDIRMPVMDGPTLIRAIRGQHSIQDLPIIVMSGTPEDINGFGGYNAFLAKPPDIGKLEMALALCLNAPYAGIAGKSR